MSTGTVIESALADEFVGGSLAGKEAKALIKELEERSGVALDKSVIGEAVTARAGRPALGPPAAAYGKKASAELEAVAERVPAIKAALESDNIERVRAAMAGKKGPALISREEVLSIFDVELKHEKAILAAAASGADPALGAKVADLLKRVPLEGNLEADARKLAKELAKEEGDRLLSAVSEQVCGAIRSKLFAAIDDPAMRKRFEEELAAARKSGADFAEAFRARLRTALPEERVQSTIAQTMQRLDGTARQRFVDEVLGSVTDPAVKALIDANFDAAGKRRLLTGYASFVKLYTEARRLKARENLIGWLYEATTFVGNLVRNATREGADVLRVAISTEKEMRDLGVILHDGVLHFNVSALTGVGGKMRQATDVLGTIPLTVGNKTVHVVRAALEAKGERGIASGVRQLLGLGKRFARNSVVATEQGDFRVGHDLFLSVEEALLALGAGKEASRRVAETVGANSRAAIVVSPLGKEAGTQVLENMAAKDLKAKDILYTGHDISRAAMEKVADGLAPTFGLEARALE
jgi:hypothetical protein